MTKATPCFDLETSFYTISNIFSEGIQVQGHYTVHYTAKNIHSILYNLSKQSSRQFTIESSAVFIIPSRSQPVNTVYALNFTLTQSTPHFLIRNYLKLTELKS